MSTGLEAMHILRITADVMLHPITIDLENKDDRQTAIGMFGLLNIITEVLIAEPKRIDNYINNLPGSAKRCNRRVIIKDRVLEYPCFLKLSI